MKQEKWMMALAMASVVLCGCGGNDAKKDDPVHTVAVTVPVPEDGLTRKTLYGVVREAGEMNLGFKTPGQIRRIYVKEGDHVRKGQLVALLDDADYKLGVDAAQAQYE